MGEVLRSCILNARTPTLPTSKSVNTPDLERLVYRRPALPEAFDPSVLLVDKAKGMTSFDVIRALRPLVKVKKVGHAGTLDPMATGLLIVLIGRGATKTMERFMDLPKEYTGTLRLGETTPSYDADTEVETRRPTDHITDGDLDAARAPFLGAITQRAPMYSAVHHEGERLYKKARRGEVVERPPRQVSIDAFEITGRDGTDVHFEVRCSKGTYIRSLAHDYGEALEVGAHLTALRRTAIGPYRVDDAWPVERLKEELG